MNTRNFKGGSGSNRRRWVSVSVAAVALAGVLLAGCSGGPADPGPDSSDGAVQVQEGGTLRMLFPADTSGLDPTLSTETIGNVIAYAIYDTLVAMDVNGKIIPELATEWSISEDGLDYQFTLREGVTFHDGSPLTADDVKFSIERLRDTPEAPKRASVAMVEEVAVDGPTSVTLHLGSPHAPLLSSLSEIASAIVPQEAVEKQGDLRRHPVGSGPFIVDDWRQGQLIDLVANPDYWDEGKPYLDGIAITFNGDTNASIAALQSNSVDFLYKAPNEVLSVLEADPDIVLAGGDGSGPQSFQYFQVNADRAPFTDPLVREAAFSAIDNESISELCLPGSSTPLRGGFMSPKYWAGADNPVYPFDQERSRELLAESSYDGSAFKIDVPGNYLDYFTCAAQAVQAQLLEVGIKSEVNAMELGQWIEAGSKVSYDSQIGSWSAAADPDIRFGATFLTDAGANWAAYSDPIMDQYVLDARLTTDSDERGDLYRAAQKQLSTTGPWHFIYSYSLFDAHSNRVHGYQFKEAVNYHGYENIWIEN